VACSGRRAPSLKDMNRMLQPKFLILLAGAVLLACFSGAQAQQESVGVTPASIDAKVKRGASYTQAFTLSNNTGTRLRFQCSAADIWYDEANKRLTGRPGTLPHSASLWTQFSPTEVVVEAHSSMAVTATITVPQTAAGGYYTMPVFEAMPVDQPKAGSTPTEGGTATASMGVRFLLLMMFTTLDAAEYNVEIMGGKVTPPSTSAELVMQLDVRNRSTAHVLVRGAFAILNSSGVLAGRGAIPEKRYLPDQRNMLQTGWAGELPPGRYTSVITLSYDRVGMEPATLVYELPLVVP
jgi:hypothetical protein